MPSFNTFKKRYNNDLSIGNQHKTQSDMIMEATWYRDIQSQTAYLYDYYLDDQPYEYLNLNSTKSKTKIPVEIKFIVNSHNSDSKDQVSYKIQFKPSFEWNSNHSFDYYKERFIGKYGAEFPIGLYCDIKDEKGNYRRWLITSEADWLDNQFPTWFVLPCDFCFKWVYDNKLYSMVGVSRSQNSYNSGQWTSRGGAVQTTIPENQKICLLPMNDYSSTIFYDQRIAISQPIPTPISWKVSKVENMNPKGINTITFAQDRWDEHTDVFEYDDGTFDFKFYSDKKIVGMWEDYNLTTIEPTIIDPNKTLDKKIHSVVSYSGVSASIKSGGSYKKFTVDFYDGELKTDFIKGEWSFEIKDKPTIDINELITVLYPEDSSDVNENQVKVKFKRNDEYIGDVFVVTYKAEDIESSVEVEILGL